MKVRTVCFMFVVAASGACRLLTAPTAAASCDGTFGSSGPMLEIKFAESLRARGCEDRLRSEAGIPLFGLKAELARLGVIEIQPLVTAPVPEMLSWHRLLLADGADVEAAIAALSKRSEVEYVYAVSDVIPPPP
jgi:hypothetical protein